MSSPSKDHQRDVSLKIISAHTETRRLKPNHLSESDLGRPHPNLSTEAQLLKDIELKVCLKDKTGIIGPLGLMGFGLTTFLLNLVNTNVFQMSPVVLGMAVAYGGLAQFIAGIFEWIKGNNFTSLAFMSYGMFWWSFVMIYAIPDFGWAKPADSMSVACYLFIWLIFSFAMLIASFTKPWAVRLIFLTLVILLILLAAGEWAHSAQTTKAGGVIGIICALCAMYTGSAEIINGAWGMTILPLGAPGEKWLKKEQ